MDNLNHKLLNSLQLILIKILNLIGWFGIKLIKKKFNIKSLKIIINFLRRFLIIKYFSL